MPFLRRREVSARTLHAEIAKTDEESVRLTTACLKGVARDEGRRPTESAGAPAAVSVPPISTRPRTCQWMVAQEGRHRDAEEAQCRRCWSGVQPDPGSMSGDSIQEAVRDAGAFGSDAVALAASYSPAWCQQRTGAFSSSAGVAMDLRLGWDLGLEAQKRLSVEKPHLFF